MLVRGELVFVVCKLIAFVLFAFREDIGVYNVGVLLLKVPSGGNFIYTHDTV